MSVQHKLEFRISKTKLAKIIIVVGGFFLFLTILPFVSGIFTSSGLVYLVVMVIVDLLLAHYIFWLASLTYVISEEGFMVRDYRGEKFIKWDEIAGVRKWPFVGKTGESSYNLELKNGKTQRLHDEMDESLIDCLKFHLPETSYSWWHD